MPRDSEPTTLPSACDELPTFDLSFRYDDDENPSEITVFPDGAASGQTTSWLSVAIEDAIPVEEIR